MKITKHKKGHYPYLKYVNKNVRGQIYEDGSGYYELFDGRSQIECEESGNLDIWIRALADEVKCKLLAVKQLKELKKQYKKHFNK